MSLNILIIGSYPVECPLHGGQKRARAIHDFLNSQMNANVKYVFVGSKKHYRKSGKYFLNIDTSVFSYNFEDLECAQMLEGNKQKFLSQLIQIIGNKFVETLDLVVLEQPYIYPLVRVLIDQYPKVKFVYSSHNIEHDMKSSIYKSLRLDFAKSEKYLSYIENLEVSCAKDADLVIAVTQRDKDYLAKYNENCILIRNGINKLDLHDTIHRTLSSPVSFLFVGSAHPPNLEGFKRFVGFNIEYLAPGSRVFIVGGVGRLIKSDSSFYREAFYSMDNFIFVDSPSDEELAFLYSNIDAVVLPIASGGGSNLKTAEALLSGKYIVATEIAMRGFEEFEADPILGLRIESSEVGFKNAMSEVSENKSKYIKSYDRPHANNLVWENLMRLSPLKSSLESLVKNMG